MKGRTCVSAARAAALLALSFCLLPPAGAGKPGGGGSTGPRFTLTDLGSNVEPTCIADDGVMGGFFYDADGYGVPMLIVPEDTNGDGVPDLWYEDADGDGVNDLMVDLGGYGQINGSNDSGQFVGYYVLDITATQRTLHACLWMDEGGDGVFELTDLGIYAYGDGNSNAFAINDDGWVAGASRSSTSWRGVVIVPKELSDGSLVWYEDANNDGGNDLMFDIGAISPRAVTPDGRIVMHDGRVIELGFSGGRPVSWSSSTLGGLGGITATECCDDLGQIAGSSVDSSGVRHAVYWKADGTLVDLGSPARGYAGYGRDLFVNGGGVTCVAGYEYKAPPPTKGIDAATYVAVYYEGTKKYVLYDQLTDKTGLSALRVAYPVNSSGVILGGLTRTDKTYGACVLVPVKN